MGKKHYLKGIGAVSFKFYSHHSHSFFLALILNLIFVPHLRVGTNLNVATNYHCYKNLLIGMVLS